MEDLLYEVESVRRFVGLRLSEALGRDDDPALPPPAGEARARDGVVRGDANGSAGAATSRGDDYGLTAAHRSTDVDEEQGEAARP